MSESFPVGDRWVFIPDDDSNDDEQSDEYARGLKTERDGGQP